MDIKNIPPDLLAKLNKLKALEEGARAVNSQEEAANAASKFQALLLKWNLDADEVMSASVQKKIEMLTDSFDASEYKYYKASDWIEKLTKGVAYYSMCRVITNRHTYKITLVGESQNVAAALYILEQLIAKVTAAYESAWKMYEGSETRGIFRRGFVNGAVVMIYAKLAKEEKAVATVTTGMELMLVNKRQLVQDYLNERFPRLRTVKQRATHIRSEDGYGEGVEAGRNIEVNKGVERGGQKYLENS